MIDRMGGGFDHGPTGAGLDGGMDGGAMDGADGTGDLGPLTAALAGLLDEDTGGPVAVRSALVAVCRGRRGAGVRTIALRRSDAAVAAPAPDRRALVYSLTKTMMAAAVLRFAVRGLVDLDAPAERWLPELTVRRAPATIAQILTHRAGLPDYGGLPAYRTAVADGGEPWSGDEFLARCGVEGPPLGTFAYSNIGYLLIRRLLERLGDASYADVLAGEVFRPLGLASATVPLERADLDGLLFGPGVLGAGPAVGGEPVAARYHPGWVSHGVAAMTAADAARFLHRLDDDAYLPEPLRRRMQDGLPLVAPLAGRPWVEPSYGLGVMVERDPAAGPYWGHTGGGPGVTPAAYHMSGRGADAVSVAVFLDGEDGALAEWMAVEAMHRLRPGRARGPR